MSYVLRLNKLNTIYNHKITFIDWSVVGWWFVPSFVMNIFPLQGALSRTIAIKDVLQRIGREEVEKYFTIMLEAL